MEGTSTKHTSGIYRMKQLKPHYITPIPEQDITHPTVVIL